jgi:DNA-binding LacI/PurR family transcriptional regulator
MSLRLLTHVEQVAVHLRAELLRRRWVGELPGEDRLGAELDVNHTTIGLALRLLENEGLLVTQGIGRRRRIVLPENFAPPSLRVGILLYERIDEKTDYMVDLLHRLFEAGHVASFASKCLVGLGMDVQRIARFVERSENDAWVVVSGSSAVLEWFAERPAPAIALAGRRRGIRIAGAGPNKVPAQKAAVRRLVELGHRRIVMLAREDRRRPQPGLMERSFLEELEACGIATSDYNLPDWNATPEGLIQRLELHFKYTAPTALIIDEMPLFFAVERHLAHLGFLAPQHVSLICLDPSPAFAWCRPTVAHINWDSRPLVQRIVHWANNVACGKEDRRQSFIKAEFIEGGTVGSVSGKR